MKIIPLSWGGGESARSTAASGDIGLLDAYSRAVIDVVERVGPAVVALSIRGSQGVSPFTPRSGDGEGVQGAGSGVVVAPDGLILTNSHVAGAGGGGSARIDVATGDGQDLRGGLRGGHPGA